MKEPQIGIEPMTAQVQIGLGDGLLSVHTAHSTTLRPQHGPKRVRSARVSSNEVATERRCSRCREWVEKDGNRDRLYQSTNASKARHPQHVRARKLVRLALLRGTIQKQPCEVGAGCAGVIHAHHEDYAQSLVVRWLCRRHHEAVHHGTPEAA